MERIIFVPFDQACQHEFRLRSENWQVAKPEKNYQIVLYTPATTNPLLLNLHGGSQIYIRGHGLFGVPAIFTEDRVGGEDAQEQQQLDITVVIDRLIAMGLQSNYRGTIKFYSCFSGLDKPPAAVPMTGQTKRRLFTRKRYLKGATWKPAAEALAQVGADYFRSLGFTHCAFIGYKGPLKGEYDVEPDADGNINSNDHKYCSRVTFDYTGAARFAFDDRSTRASQAQRQF